MGASPEGKQTRASFLSTCDQDKSDFRLTLACWVRTFSQLRLATRSKRDRSHWHTTRDALGELEMTLY